MFVGVCVIQKGKEGKPKMTKEMRKEFAKMLKKTQKKSLKQKSAGDMHEQNMSGLDFSKDAQQATNDTRDAPLVRPPCLSLSFPMMLLASFLQHNAPRRITKRMRTTRMRTTRMRTTRMRTRQCTKTFCKTMQQDAYEDDGLTY